MLCHLHPTTSGWLKKITLNKRLIGIVCSWKGWTNEIIMKMIGWKITKSIAQVTVWF